jgi:hypothetical protein
MGVLGDKNRWQQEASAKGPPAVEQPESAHARHLFGIDQVAQPE